MNKSKKIGIAIFLLLSGSLEARVRLNNSESHTPVVRKAPAPPASPKPQTVSSKKKAKRKAKYKAKEIQRKKDRLEAKKVKSVRIGDGRFKNYQQELNYGFMLYHKEKRTELLDAVNAAANPTGLLSTATEKDIIEITKSKPALQVSYVVSAVYENLPALFKRGKTTEAAIGIQASFAKKNDAYQGTHRDVDVAGNLRTRQSIKKWAVLVFGQYELFRYAGWRYNFKLGAGLSVGALRDLRIYEDNNGILSNTGQRAVAKKSQPTVEFGFNIAKEAGPIDVIFAWDVGYVKQKYSDILALDAPDAGASTKHQNNFTTLRHDAVRHLIFITPPTFKLWSFNFKMGAGFNF